MIMKISKLFLGLLACAALSACSNDESGVISNDVPKVFNGDEAYISVRLADAGATTRATAGDYEYGTTEQKIENAYFYFYDEHGVFVAQGNAWNGGTATTPGNPAGNIEFKSNAVVVLKGLNNKKYPKYMVTVLNKPNSFIHGNTLDEMEVALAKNGQEVASYTNNGDTYFTMSTTSFANQGLKKYFVTEVKDEHFSLEPISGTIANAVPIYVERLAAKVSLGVSKDLEATMVDDKYYVIKATVAGEGNSSESNIAAENLYVELLGWKLNATAKESNIVKNIDENWTDAGLGFAWNNPAHYRSHWGKSFNYDKSGTYPTTAGDAGNSTYLNYVNLKDNCVDLGGVAYCAENTNTSRIVTDNFPSAVTSILLKARICDANGAALDLIRYNGLLFKKEWFLQYVLNILQSRNALNVWYEDPASTSLGKKYVRIGTEYVTLVNVGDGVVKVAFKNDGNTPLYSQVDENTFNLITDFSVLNDALKDVSAGAVGYTGGLMYYNIPIEHLNEADATNDDIPEARYGVVRNHCYVVTIDKLENIGKGIPDEDDVIIPGDDDSKTYYVGANINILSWKLVNQKVDL